MKLACFVLLVSRTERVMAGSGYGALARALKITTRLCGSYGGHCRYRDNVTGRWFSSGEKANVSRRPSLMPFNSKLENTVHLIGFVGNAPALKTIEKMHISLACFTLAVHGEDLPESSWFCVDVWKQQLAQGIVEHVKQGDLVYVSGRLVVQYYTGKGGIHRSTAKVTAAEVNFVDAAPDDVHAVVSSARKLETERKWRAFFADPTKWWDVRQSKTNENAPDFRHITTKQGLWLDSKYNPSWLASQLAEMESSEQRPVPE